MELCRNCNERPVAIFKRGLCSRCYQKLRKENGPFLKDKKKWSKPTESKMKTRSELEFIKNYFKGNTSWVYQPAVFRFNGVRYSPDFYDQDRNVFIEVAGTRQAYHQNKEKYKLFRKYFPKIKLEVRLPDGELLREVESNKWKFQYSNRW